MIDAMEHTYTSAEAEIDRQIDTAVGDVIGEDLDGGAVSRLQELIAQRARMMREPWEHRRASRMARRQALGIG